MNVIDPSWARWINASISKHFSDLLTAANLAFYVEGQDRQTESKQNYCEIRFDGPIIDRYSPTTFKIYVTINTLIVNIKDSSSNIYTFDQNIGIVMACFTNAIQVFRYGTGPDDDQGELTCLKLSPRIGKDMIETQRFGQSQPAIRLQEATIEAKYEALVSPTPISS